MTVTASLELQAAVLNYEAATTRLPTAEAIRRDLGISDVIYRAALQRALDRADLFARHPALVGRLRRLRELRRRLREPAPAGANHGPNARQLPIPPARPHLAKEEAMSQPKVLIGQAELGGLLRDAGMASASAFASPEWKERVDAAIDQLAATGDSFTAEDVRQIAGDPPGHPNAMGARFYMAARRGVIRKLGYRKAERASLHSHPIALWIGGRAARKEQAS